MAKALDVDVGRLFFEDAAQEKITVERPTRNAEGERYRVLASSLLGKTMSPFVVRPTEPPADDAHPEHAGQEFMFVHTGTIEFDYGDQTFTLEPGDSAYFDASVSHKIRALGAARAEVVVAHAEPGAHRLEHDRAVVLLRHAAAA